MNSFFFLSPFGMMFLSFYKGIPERVLHEFSNFSRGLLAPGSFPGAVSANALSSNVNGYRTLASRRAMR